MFATPVRLLETKIFTQQAYVKLYATGASKEYEGKVKGKMDKNETKCYRTAKKGADNG